jgi:hypothetical protein
MSYTLMLQCGCHVYVSCHPRTGVAHTRIIERRGPSCLVRQHEVGARLYLWELLPDPKVNQEMEPTSPIEWM